MSSGEVESIKASLKKAAAALRDAGVPFLVGGGLASWARGGPESGHDVDFMIKPEHAERALVVLEEAGMQGERPPEGWLLKAYDGDVMIDLIFEPSGLAVTDDMMERGEEVEVLALPMRVMSLEDVMITKLAALREHALRYDSLLEITRALREQIDWDDVRRRSPATPFVAAFFTLAEELGLVPRQSSGVNSPVAVSSNSTPPDAMS